MAKTSVFRVQRTLLAYLRAKYTFLGMQEKGICWEHENVNYYIFGVLIEENRVVHEQRFEILAGTSLIRVK